MFISENTSPELYWLPNFIPHEKASVLGGNVVAESFFKKIMKTEVIRRVAVPL